MKRLFRCRDDAQIAGVCSGLGRYLEMDPVFIRVVTLAVTFLTGIVPGVLSYLAAWIIVPQEPAPPVTATPTHDSTAARV